MPEDRLKRSPLIIIDTSAVREGKLPALEKAMTDLAAMAGAGEADTIAYQVFFDDRRERMTVIQVHPDSVSAEVHLKVAAPSLPAFSSLVRMSAMDIYGKPGADLLERLQLKARMLGTGDVSVHTLHAGFARFLPESLRGEAEEERGLIARASVIIHAPAGRVWHALTDPAAIRQYFFGTTASSDWKEKSPITWAGEWEGKRYEDRGVILRSDPGKLLRFTHFSPLTGLPDAPEHYHTITIRILEEGGDTRVTLSQDNNAGEESRDHSQKNWEAVLAGLKTVVENDPVLKMFAEYERAFAALDLEKNAALFAETFISAGPRGVIAQDRAEFLKLADRAAGFYRSIGQTSARILFLHETIISREYSLFRVHWGVTFEKTGSRMIEFDVSYLVQTVPEPRILLFVAHEDEEKAMRELGLLAAAGYVVPAPGPGGR